MDDEVSALIERSADSDANTLEAKLAETVKTASRARALVEEALHRRYLDFLSALESSPPVDPEHIDEFVRERLRLIRIERLVYAERREKIQELLNVLTAIRATETSACCVLVSDGSDIHLCVGVIDRGGDKGRLADARAVLAGALSANFSGSKVRPLDNASAASLLESPTLRRANAIGAITGFPSLKQMDEGGRFVQGLERFLDGMRGREFAFLVLADPVSSERLARVRDGFTGLHNIISLAGESEVGLQDQFSQSEGETLSESVSRALAESVALTNTATAATGDATTRPTIAGYALGLVGAGVGFMLGGPPGAAAGAGLGLAAGGARTKSQGRTSTSGSTRTTSTTDTETSGRSVASTRGQSASASRTVHFRDRGLRRYQEHLDLHLSRLEDGERYGFWNAGIYVLAPDHDSVLVGTSILRGLFTGDESELERPRAHIWGPESAQLEAVRAALGSLTHPQFRPGSSLDDAAVSAGAIESLAPVTLMSSRDLAIVMGLPQRSAPGLTVHETASFGRQVSCDDWAADRVVLGRVFHHRTPEASTCTLDRGALTRHVFVGGTTGAGKTSATMGLLEGLWKGPSPVSFLVIEPVKGEYERLVALGTSTRPVRRFGVTPGAGRLLRINPFEFPSATHVYEHIDRLVQVFSAAFPMYGAMPALLEEGIRRAYEAVGWDLEASSVRGQQGFPTLRDLEWCLDDAVREAGYSDRLQADFEGSLVTRVRSLSRGIRGSVLAPLPGLATPTRDLFDEPCIINLAGIPSPQTKALVMALLVARLQEHRAAEGFSPSLRHVTVLEEAHHLLRAHGTEQSDESANLRGLAVEMFGNAIAEMRAYGEGFVLVDQSPSALDASALRNTNTKIVFRLPLAADREAAGETISTTKEQRREIGRLPRQVAVVHQSEWLEPVLCQVRDLDLPPVNRALEEVCELSNEQIFAIFAIPAVGVEAPMALAATAVERIGWTLEKAFGFIEAAWSVAGLGSALERLYAAGEVDYTDLRELLARPGTRSGHTEAVLAQVGSKIGLASHRSARLARADGAPLEEWRSVLLDVFPRERTPVA